MFSGYRPWPKVIDECHKWFNLTVMVGDPTTSIAFLIVGSRSKLLFTHFTEEIKLFNTNVVLYPKHLFTI